MPSLWIFLLYLHTAYADPVEIQGFISHWLLLRFWYSYLLDYIGGCWMRTPSYESLLGPYPNSSYHALSHMLSLELRSISLLQGRRISAKSRAQETTGESGFLKVDLGVFPGYLPPSTSCFLKQFSYMERVAYRAALRG